MKQELLCSEKWMAGDRWTRPHTRTRHQIVVKGLKAYTTAVHQADVYNVSDLISFLQWFGGKIRQQWASYMVGFSWNKLCGYKIKKTGNRYANLYILMVKK